MVAALGGCEALAAPVWKDGPGDWQEAARWGGSVPDPRSNASIEGNSRVRLARGDVALSQLDVGAYRDADATCVMDGGTLMLSKLLRMGEMTGAAGKFVQNDGEILALEICVGGASTGSGSDRRATGELEIRGGRLLTRHLTFGWGGGSTARLRIVGSKARPLAVLDYLWVGIRQEGVGGSRVELSYEIDAGGVTPIEVWSKSASPVALIDQTARSTCRLHVSLRDTPPNGEIPLIRLPRACRGTFTDLPEGSAVRAAHGNQMYEWTLTYRGGPEKTDVVLTDPRTIDADGRRAAYNAGKPSRAPVLTHEDVASGLRAMERRQTALLKPLDQTATRAFPGAEGFGAFSRGGRGGKVHFVTNLDDSGPGSLREALAARGPRTIVFRIGGVIALGRSLVIREPYVTVAGQTAPGDGICIRADSSIQADALVLSGTHDVVLRHLRVQHGKGPQEPRPDDGGDCIAAYDSENFIIDHCSTHWGTDETVSVTGAVDLYTVQWCIIAEGLNYERHSMSTILSGDRCTWHHNLFAHAGSRNPLFAGQPRCDFRNNVIYNWGHTSGQGNFTRLNYVGNFLRPGPSTVQKPLKFLASESVTLDDSLHLAGNIMDGSDELTRDNWLGAAFDRACRSDAPFPMVPIADDSAETALSRVLQNAGAILPKRDAADARVVADVRDSTGKIIASQQEVGGWPRFASSSAAPADGDNDGIADEWEIRSGLNPKDPADAAMVAADGYTWLETYLDHLTR
jgi:hypothetical protein